MSGTIQQDSVQLAQDEGTSNNACFVFEDDPIPNIERLSTDSLSVTSLEYSEDTSTQNTSLTGLRGLSGSSGHKRLSIGTFSSIFGLLELEDQQIIDNYTSENQNDAKTPIPQYIEASFTDSTLHTDPSKTQIALTDQENTDKDTKIDTSMFVECIPVDVLELLNINW